MPWEKSFDESDVVDCAMRVFWEKGYASTSISDITDATGIKRGSLYNAFEGKHDLFLKSLLKYDDEQRRQRLRKLESIDDPREAIATFFDHIVKDSLKDPARRGCLVINTSLDYPQHDEEVRKIVDDAFRELTDFFERAIRRGHERGEIPQTVEPRPTAKALVALLVGLRVLGRGAFGKTALQQIAAQAQRLIS
ncbi:HTH-type transcriptional repressor ComR [Maioricimonas rarisocia]|uniref:HTH-type transcriptional repressor ComR n=1 Tax=Maioricimonas rarisocia TaxID=2528026 RepID=A0A517Z391_9PLAN|nr:TetR/AcrR family transcriptional regulator [Maioricimonas rarisocia]QDU36943.1 HTH-type transcriptional repressor ComR [Maioricimonas rarisocia]